MKSIFRRIVFYAVALFLTSQVITGLHISGGLTTYLIGGAILSLFFVVKPILSLITLPLNIMTLGLFSFVINAIILYLLTIANSNISVTAFTFKGSAFAGFVIPSLDVNSFFAFIAASIVLSLIFGALRWLTEK